MNYEDYLIETKHTILAITKLSQMIADYLEEYYWDFIKGKCVEQSKVDEIKALNKAIRLILYCAREQRKLAYKEIEPEYKDKFCYDDVLYG